MTDVPVQPSGWRILVEPVEIQKQTSGGIILADEAVRAQEYLRYFGRVVSMGPLCYCNDRFKPHQNAAIVPWCKVGDMVIFDRHAGQEVIQKRGDEVVRYRVINDDNVLGVITDESSIVTPM